jgi:NADPH2:quinone reductase
VGLARAAGLRAGEMVAVTAAAGGLGSLLVQLAVEVGATVVALAGSARKLEHAAGLGAQHVVDYECPGWTADLDSVGPLDVVFDGVGGAVRAALAQRVATGGRFVPHGAASGVWGDVASTVADRRATLVSLDAVGAGPGELHELVEDALARAAAGSLRPSIGLELPLEGASEAHAAMEARRVIGKTLLVVAPVAPG